LSVQIRSQTFAAKVTIGLTLALAAVALATGGARVTPAAAADAGQWPSVGRTLANRSYSPLAAINQKNVRELSLAGYYDIPTHFGQEATPLAIGGILYFSTDWSIVKAVDARTGRLLWSYDPRARRGLVNGCCGPVSRGVAYWRGKVFVGTLDGRLIALDAANGKEFWQVRTTDPKLPYTITGAPLVADGRVIIGNGGADMGAVRGYVSAYDAETGRLAWRFYTVPGPPGRPDHAVSDAVLSKIAAPTWHGRYWRYGGGGTVWGWMAYDPRLDLLYIGTGNGTPWNQGLRSQGRGDNLFTCSILALRAKTGRYVWHYQTTPGDAWDFDADEQMTLANLRIHGRQRQVLMEAPKNGYFYVLDRATGRLISARPYVPMTWSTGIDPKTGRPIVAAQARYFATKSRFVVQPSGVGGHSWQSMAYSPATGLVYIPAQQLPLIYLGDDSDARFGPLQENLGTKFAFDDQPHPPPVTGWLIAWNPVTQREVWRVTHPVPWNGGVLATAGGLVFQGDAEGTLTAYSAASGRKLWSFQGQTGIVAAPMAYEIGRTEYIAVLTGWGGGVVMMGGARLGRIGPNRLLIFSLGGTASLPPVSGAAPPKPSPPSAAQSPGEIAAGSREYATYCSRCHGVNVVSGGVAPDLRYSTFLGNDIWYQIVLQGALAGKGMASFGRVLDRQRASAIRAYVISEAQKAVH
jgi:quinohemoprotein ethanol dehydrogenase